MTNVLLHAIQYCFMYIVLSVCPLERANIITSRRNEGIINESDTTGSNYQYQKSTTSLGGWKCDEIVTLFRECVWPGNEASGIEKGSFLHTLRT